MSPSIITQADLELANSDPYANGWRIKRHDWNGAEILADRDGNERRVEWIIHHDGYVQRIGIPRYLYKMVDGEAVREERPSPYMAELAQ